MKILNENDEVIDEVHGAPPLPRAIAPGEKILLTVSRPVPTTAGRYKLKIDLLDQDICWFEQRGSEPLVLEFQVEE